MPDGIVGNVEGLAICHNHHDLPMGDDPQLKEVAGRVNAHVKEREWWNALVGMVLGGHSCRLCGHVDPLRATCCGFDG